MARSHDNTVWISCLAVTLLTISVLGTIDTVGNRFESDSALDGDAFGIFLMDDIRFPKAVIFNFSAYCVRPQRSVWFQVWRAIDEKSKLYTLVGQAKLTTNVVPTYYQKRLYTRDEMIFTEHGDRLAIYHEDQQSPVAYTFVPPDGNHVYRQSSRVTGKMKVGTNIKFLDIEFPYRFAVSATYDTDIDRYLQSGTGTLIPPTIPPTQRETIPPIPADEGTIRYVGNPLTSRDSIMTSEAQGVYLLRHIQFKKGVVTSFFGYFVRRAPIWFQIWRPIDTAEGLTYMLVDQVRYQTQMFPSREQLNLEMGSYIFTEENDVLGLMVEDDTNPIGFSWIYEDSDQRPLGGRPQDNELSVYYPGYNLTFSNVELPYNFAAGAKYDTVRRNDLYGSPRPIVVTTPPTTTTTTPRSTTIPELVKSPSIGKETIRYTRRSLRNRTRNTFLIGDSKFPESAMVTSFYAYFVNNGRVQFQVWRELQDNQFKLIGMKNYYANTVGYAQIQLSDKEQFRVAPGDCMGYYNDDIYQGTIGYHFEASNLYYNDSDFTFLIDRVLHFEQMPYPYRFAIAASYKPVPDNTTPDPCPSGVPNCGRPTRPAQASSQTEEPFGWLLNTRLLLVLFIWLIVLTVFFIILCGVMFCRAQRKRKAVYRRPYSFTNPVTSSRPTSFNKWDDLRVRDDGTIDYFEPAMSHNRGNSRQNSKASHNRAENGQTTSDRTNSVHKNNSSTRAQINTHM